jgi:hypothetical protein
MLWGVCKSGLSLRVTEIVPKYIYIYIYIYIWRGKWETRREKKIIINKCGVGKERKKLSEKKKKKTVV